MVIDYDKVLEIARKKIDMRMLKNDPKAFESEMAFSANGKYSYDKIPLNGNAWTKSFLYGAVALMYYHTKDEKYLKYLEDSYDVYKKFLDERKGAVAHDTGFLYIPYAIAWYEVSGSQLAYELACRAADDYAKRFTFEPGILQGFGWCDDIASTIIDDMMNNSLLLWGGKHSQRECFYSHIYGSHTKQVIKYMLRDDYTFKHSYAFETATGNPLGERNICGFSNGTIWARGQAWGIYGLINVLYATNDCNRYISVIDGLINKTYELYPEDGIPCWDLARYKHIGEVGMDIPDTSAAVIMASALEKMRLYTMDHDLPSIYTRDGIDICGELSDTILENIVKSYMANDSAENIIEGGQCGKIAAGTVWGDYFFIEALMRKKYGKDCPEIWS